MGGAQPLACTMAGASMLAVECDPTRIQKRLDTKYLDYKADTLDEALAIINKSCSDNKPIYVGLLGNAADSDFLLPRTTLGDVLPRPAMAWLADHGAELQLRTAARSLRPGVAGGWRIETDRGPIDAGQIVLAVPPHQAARLLSGAAGPALLASLDAFEHEPIATVWLGWRDAVPLPDAVMLAERPEAAEHGQWLFGRNAPPGSGVRSLAGVVVSAAGRASERPAELAAAIARQVAAQRRLPTPDHARAIVDKRATIRCSPGRPRVDVDALARDCPGIALAGDWVWHRYPATIESAVRAGDAAATWLGGAESAASARR
jgi:hypothetical protein